MVRVDVAGLSARALAATAGFHAEVLPGLPEGQDLLLVFPPADHAHHAWRLAAVQTLARDRAPHRVNAVASDSEEAIAAAGRYLAAAPGVTGQYWPLDAQGACAA